MSRNVIAALLATVSAAWSQGTFQNLDFECPILPLPSGSATDVSIAKALPGWSGYIGAAPVDTVLYNTVSLGAPAISLQGPGGFGMPFQGDYFVGLKPSFPGGLVVPAIAQAGLVPLGTKSLVFLISSADRPQVLFAGQPIPLAQISTGPNYVMLGGDVSQFAGRSGELRFTGGGFLDDIRFSDQAIPEPRAIALLFLGAVILGARLKRR